MIEAEIDCLLPPRPYSRRAFVQASIGTGFAAAAGPIAAQTAIKTDSEGLVVGEVSVPVGDFKVPVYRAAPAGKREAPLVLVVSEIFGVHEHIADVARRFAKAGYFALAPELFARQGDPAMYGEVSKLVAEVVSQAPDAQVMQDLDACVAWARTQGASADRVGITGFCWGGRIVWLYAAHQPALRAAVAWYGRIDGERTPLQPTYPIDVAATLKAPVLGLYGGQDPAIPLAQVERMRKALAGAPSAAARASRMHVYADAPHAFHADYRPSYRAEAARDGWQRTLKWFADHGVA
jgi:carboxymethylenebutenolidase